MPDPNARPVALLLVDDHALSVLGLCLADVANAVDGLLMSSDATHLARADRGLFAVLMSERRYAALPTAELADVADAALRRWLGAGESTTEGTA